MPTNTHRSDFDLWHSAAPTLKQHLAIQSRAFRTAIPFDRNILIDSVHINRKLGKGVTPIRFTCMTQPPRTRPLSTPRGEKRVSSVQNPQVFVKCIPVLRTSRCSLAQKVIVAFGAWFTCVQNTAPLRIRIKSHTNSGFAFGIVRIPLEVPMPIT